MKKKKRSMNTLLSLIISIMMIAAVPMSVLAEDSGATQNINQLESPEVVEEENSVSDVVSDEIKDTPESNSIPAVLNMEDGEHTLKIKYSSHVSNIGWQDEMTDGEMAGTIGRNLSMEALKIDLENTTDFKGGIEYSAHVRNIGWQEPVGDGAEAGTTGQALSIEAMKIHLTGELAEQYDVYYRVHATNYGWLGWAKNGEQAGTAGYAYSVQAIEIKVYEKSATDTPVSEQKVFISKETLGDVIYRGHVQNLGWLGDVYDGETAGTVGKNLNMEAFEIRMTDSGRGELTGSVLYQAYIQDEGWQKEISDGNIAGSVGKNKRIEAVKIKLTEQLEEQYDVYYRVHSTNYGWLGWAKNGEIAGTLDLNLAVQAMEVKLYAKDALDKPAQDVASYESLDTVGAVIYRAHVTNIGWQDYLKDGETAGTVGRNLNMEALNVRVTDLGREGSMEGSILYQTHVRDIGWMDEVSDGKTAGTVGKNKPIEALRMRLSGELEENYDIYYRAHVANYGWLGWAKNGSVAGTVGYANGVQAVEIRLCAKDAVDAPTLSERSYLSGENIGKLSYKVSAENIGWQGEKTSGETAGTTGEDKAIKELSMSIDNTSVADAYTGGIQYRLHLSNVGWLGWSQDGQVSGDAVNQAEAVEIKLTGELEKYADVYYRTHTSDYGWLGWAKNGQSAGTTKCRYKLQAIQVKILPKGALAPGSNSNYYKETPNIKMISRFSTVSTNTPNGFYNMSRALSSFNGVVIQPGQTLSFFGVAGPCGAAQGYRPAGVVGGTGYGGGICQASTTLYGAAIRAGMTIVERNNHSVASTYVPRGLDAMVDYGSSDLKFRNDLGFPVTIRTYTTGNTLVAEFHGKDPGWFDFIDARSQVSGRYATAQRLYYKNGAVFRIENLPSSYYAN